MQREFVNYTRTVDDWHRDVEHIRSLVRDGNWRQCNIDAACEVFELSEAERSHYFGAIDGK